MGEPMRVLVIASYSVPLEEIIEDLEKMDIAVIETMPKIAGLVVDVPEGQPITRLYDVNGIISFEEDRPVSL
jgi:hypothetical protein